MLIGYARVSTDEQNLELQLSALKQVGCSRIYCDTGISGKKTRRVGLDKVLTRLHDGDTLVVWRLDRLGRSLSHLIHTITRLEKRGVHFRSLTEIIDTSSSAGRLVFHIMGAMAEFEHALISERTRAGMRVAKKRGAHIGRPAILSILQREQIIEGLQRGRSAATLAQTFGVSTATIRRLRPHEPKKKQVEG